MREHHILVSTFTHDQQVVWHVYTVRRNPLNTDLASDMENAFAKLTDVAKQDDEHWSPVLLCTNLTDSSGVALQHLLTNYYSENTATPWHKYRDKKEDFFSAIFAFPTDSPDNQELLRLH